MKPDPFAGLKRRLAKKLAGFTSDFPQDLSSWDMESHRPDAKAFPVPEMVLFMLRNIMRWSWQGQGEKVRWTVYGSVDGEPIGFELRKFGFTVLRVADAKVPMSRIIGQLTAGCREIEAFLEPYAKEKVALGDVLVVNRYSEFESRYRYFRENADKAYRRAEKPRRKRRTKAAGLEDIAFSIADVMNAQMHANHEGFYNSTAMIDAFFSALEHKLILLRAFSGAPLAEGDLLQMISSKWDDKLQMVLPVTGQRDLEILLGAMRRIKERIRNPFAHGGVENDGGSLFFDLPSVGMMPANFSRFGDSVRFSFIPIEAESHAECCGAFDRLDELLSSGPLAGPHRLMDAGVDPSFDADTMKKYRDALAEGEDAIERYIDQWGDAWMRHANMDY